MDLQVQVSEAADNATPSGSQMLSPSTTSPSTKTSSHRRRLQPQALVILEDYFRQVSQNPNHTEKEALLKKIKAIPGCLDYDLGRLTRWFASRRQRLRLKEQKDNNSRFPSLTPAAVQHLTVLASNQLHPSPELLKTWTTLLASSGAVEQDVINWIHHRNQEQSLLQHASTPSDTNTTMTPEPSPISPISQSQTKSTTSPPPYKRQETTASPAALQLAHRNEHHAARATPSEPSQSSPISNNELNKYIIHGVRDALASSQTMPGMPTAAPKTATEFEALFSPSEQQISLLLHTLESTQPLQSGAPINQ